MVAVIKSTKESGIAFDQPGTDSALYKQAGADAIALLAPDQLIIQRKPSRMDLLELSQFLFPDADIVIAEGFKRAPRVPKIEVRRNQDEPWIHQQVLGVIAVASSFSVTGLKNFTLSQSSEIANFIETEYLSGRTSAPAGMLSDND